MLAGEIEPGERLVELKLGEIWRESDAGSRGAPRSGGGRPGYEPVESRDLVSALQAEVDAAGNSILGQVWRSLNIEPHTTVAVQQRQVELEAIQEV